VGRTSGRVERFDVVVVGSGFGGSVAACRLAEAGRSVLVLERGQPWPPGSFPRTPHAMRSAFWEPAAGRHGLFEVLSFSGLDAVVASGVGGGSLIYANVMLRKDPDTFVREDLDDGGRERWPIGYDELEPYYERAEAMQGATPYPYDSAKTLALLEAARAVGMPAERPPLAIAFAAAPGAQPAPREPLRDARPNLHDAPRSTCRLCGECDLGCNDGAKQTVDFTYLSAAARAGAGVRACCEVFGLEPLPDGGWAVRYEQHLEARDGHREQLLDPSPDRRRTVHAARVVLAAGTFGSTRLLLRNRASLPRLSPRLGRGFSGNGDLLAFVRDAGRALHPSQGPVITASVRVPGAQARHGRELLVQDAGAPAFTEWMWQALEVPEDLWGMRRTIARRLRDRLRGRRDTSLGAELSEAFGTARMSAAMMPVLAMGRDVPDGRITLRGDALELDWSDRPSAGYFDDAEDAMSTLAAAMGGHRQGALGRLVTVHPLGGCGMGATPAEGVVDEWGQVFGCPGLHVADGSIMPGPVGANPSLTIAALSERIAERMAAA
jgi:cholesterol oxidase